jgi:hypothetical protein
MIRGGWIPFESSERRDAVRFDMMGLPPAFIRIRDRSRDDSRGRAYIVIDLGSGKVVEDQTEYRPKNGDAQRGQ